MKILHFASLLIINLLIACKNDTDQIAKELCDCLRPIVEVYNDTQGLSAEDSAEDIQAAMEKMDQAAAESDACADRMDEKYGDLEEKQEAVEAAMQRVCPDIVAVMNEIEESEN